MLQELLKRTCETYGIQPIERYYTCKDAKYLDCSKTSFCDTCTISKEVFCYPDFTKNKQISLIYYLMNNFDLCIRKGTFCLFYMDTKFNRGCGIDSNSFEDALLELTIDISPNLDYDNKVAIKRILEDEVNI